MPRLAKTKPADLVLDVASDPDGQVVDQDDKERSLPNRRSSPLNVHGVDLSSFAGGMSPTLASLPPLPSSPTSPGRGRDPSTNFLAGFRNRMAPDQEKRDQQSSMRPTRDDDDAYRPSSSSVSKIYHLKKTPGSTPELNLVGSSEHVAKVNSEGSHSHSEASRPPPSPLPSEDSSSIAKRKENKGFRNPLSRAKSIRRDSNSKSKPSTRLPLEQPPKTAPLTQDWPASADTGFLRARSKEKRGKSADRSGASESEENLSMAGGKIHSGFMTGSKQVMSKAKTGGGAFLNRLGKIGRSGSGGHEREIPDSEYVCKVINLPLIDQTRITRISKDLQSCRDKTEFWMPSLPWRCIDYLNLNCEAEGLYRVPGSAPEVKRWQRRFDTELDVDLLDEKELYDPNTIGSMLKSWLRDLPTEIMPKIIQHQLGEELAKENPDYQRLGEPVPQKLRNALSDLPPFNYYLLFAVTCHLSLLLANKDKNKMDLNNLSICIGPPLELERWLFNYLVGDWRNCWQGCFTERLYLDAEKAHQDGREYILPAFPAPHPSFDRNPDDEYYDEHAVRTDSSSSEPVTIQVGEAGTSLTSSKDVQSFPARNPANYKSSTYQSVGLSKFANGRVASPESIGSHATLHEMKRPTTAKDEGPRIAEISANDYYGHSRSKSDILSNTPVKPDFAAELTLPVRQ